MYNRVSMSIPISISKPPFTSKRFQAENCCVADAEFFQGHSTWAWGGAGRVLRGAEGGLFLAHHTPRPTPQAPMPLVNGGESECECPRPGARSRVSGSNEMKSSQSPIKPPHMHTGLLRVIDVDNLALHFVIKSFRPARVDGIGWPRSNLLPAECLP